MMRAPFLITAVAILTSPLVAVAQPTPASPTDRPGVDIGLRLGVGFPFGKVFSGNNTDLSDGISALIPIQLDVGYRINPMFTVGAYVAYGYALTKNCDTGSTCSASDTRLGIEGIARFPTDGSFAPWVGLGIGYEWLSLKQDSTSLSLKGWEFLNLQAGAEFHASPDFGIGPYASFSLGRYDTAELAGTSADIPDTAFHEWLVLGIRGTFNL